MHHSTELQERGALPPGQRAVLERVVARIAFEFTRRIEEEFAPKPGDDDSLEAYEDPDLIERDFEDSRD